MITTIKITSSMVYIDGVPFPKKEIPPMGINYGGITVEKLGQYKIYIDGNKSYIGHSGELVEEEFSPNNDSILAGTHTHSYLIRVFGLPTIRINQSKAIISQIIYKYTQGGLLVDMQDRYAFEVSCKVRTL